MPEYEYVCEKDHESQITQKITEDPVEECPECGAPCRRIISKGGSFVLRGGGWAAHGYGNT
jgi:putative FmdB family regulatory protein